MVKKKGRHKKSDKPRTRQNSKVMKTLNTTVDNSTIASSSSGNSSVCSNGSNILIENEAPEEVENSASNTVTEQMKSLTLLDQPVELPPVQPVASSPIDLNEIPLQNT